MVARAASGSNVSSSLTLSWALGELRKQLGGGSAQLEAHLQRVAASHGHEAKTAALEGPQERGRELGRSPGQSTSSSMQALGCMVRRLHGRVV